MLGRLRCGSRSQAAQAGHELPAFLGALQAAWAGSSHALVGLWPHLGRARHSQARRGAHVVQVLTVLLLAAATVALSRRLLPKPTSPVWLIDTGALPCACAQLADRCLTQLAARSVLARQRRAQGPPCGLHRGRPQARGAPHTILDEDVRALG